MTIEDINDFYSEQFRIAPEFKSGYDALKGCMRRSFKAGDIDVWLQLNPGRSKSTLATTDNTEIEKRPCFLCKDNRPVNQIINRSLENWDWLINPYPIFPVHFTIASKNHEIQGEMPLDMIAAADSNTALVFFFNGARAGASAPDHLHFQGVLKEELPLLDIIEKTHDGEHSCYRYSSEMGLDLPMRFVSFLIYPDLKGMAMMSLIPKIFGFDSKSGKPDAGMVNTLVWLDYSRRLRCIVFPRKNHRSEHYFRQDSSRLAISPGAIDMAGMLITPDEDTFHNLTYEDIISIYNETGLTAGEFEKWRKNSDRILHPDF